MEKCLQKCGKGADLGCSSGVWNPALGTTPEVCILFGLNNSSDKCIGTSAAVAATVRLSSRQPDELASCKPGLNLAHSMATGPANGGRASVVVGDRSTCWSSCGKEPFLYVELADTQLIGDVLLDVYVNESNFPICFEPSLGSDDVFFNHWIEVFVANSTGPAAPIVP